MAQDIRAWRADMGLDQYAEAFERHDLSLGLAADLSDEDLEKIGVTSMGHRKRILRAIEAIREGSSGAASDVDVSAETKENLSAALSKSGAERRQLTILFCDLVGSTALSAKLDPEEMSEVIRAYQNTVAGEIARYQGHVAKFMGDGVLVYFGYPRAHEDEAERAVRAGLDLVRSVAELSAPDGEALAVRVGIATGLVVVGDLLGDGAAQEEAVVGETPNLAARLQAMAAPGTVLIASGTRRLLGSLFELVELGPQSVRGFVEPVPVWRAVGERPISSRFEAVRGQHLTRFVGREHEIALLLDRWHQARGGEGQVVLLSGEAGIGKSRITQELTQRVRAEPHLQLHYQCSPHHANTVLYPFVQQLTYAADIAPHDPPNVRLDRVEKLLARGSQSLSRVVPLFADLLSIPIGDRYPPLDLTPPQRKSATFDALLEQLAGLASVRPTLVVFEDLHWADPTSLELWELAMPRIAKLPVLAVLTFRPEFEPPWGNPGNVTSLSLNRLGRSQATRMVAHRCQSETLPAGLLEQILDHSDGNPLFLEELTTAVLGHDLADGEGSSDALTGHQGAIAVPSSLQDSLLARLDRLTAAKDVAQFASVIGRTFDSNLLASATDKDAADLRLALDQLVEEGIVQSRGLSPVSRYEFKHALLRDAAYQSLLRSKRQQYHLKIARVLEQYFPQVVENDPEVVAHHCTEAGLSSEAAVLWERAGRRALEFSSYREAIDHLKRALALLLSLPASTERDARELDVQMALGAAWIAAKAYSAEEVRMAYKAAAELAGRVGSTEQRFASLRGLWNNHLMRLELNTAKELGEELRAVAQQSGDPEDQLVVTERGDGTVLMALGQHRQAHACFKRAISLYDPSRHRDYVRRYGEDPGIWSYVYASWTGDWLGHRDYALDAGRKAIEIARKLPTPLTLVIALADGATLHQFRRDIDATLECAEEAIALAEPLGLVQHRAWASIHRGWALACGGRTDDGLAEIEAGLASWRDFGGLNNRTHFLNLLADACLLAGRPEAGMEALDEAEEIARRTDLHAHDAETHRRRGELHLVLGDETEAERAWLRAIEVAHMQGARTLELRAATNLAKFWRDQRKTNQARSLLLPIHDSFTEGFDTLDLIDARSLLDELS